MASRLTIAVVVLVARVAHAQETPPDALPPSDAPPPPATDASPPPPPPTTTPTDAPPTPPPPPPPSPSPPPPPAAKPAPKAPSDAGLVFGVGFGVAGATGIPADIYGPAFGLELLFGLAYRDTSVEARTGLGFATLPANDALAGDATRGSIDLRSLVIRQRFAPSPAVALSVAAGVATGSVPILSLGTDEFSDKVVVDQITGSGVTARAALHVALSHNTELVGEVAGYALWWELPGHPYITNPMAMPSTTPGTTSATYTMSTAEIASTPWSVTVGVRTRIPF